jgi:hypothetical protein
MHVVFCWFVLIAEPQPTTHACYQRGRIELNGHPVSHYRFKKCSFSLIAPYALPLLLLFTHTPGQAGTYTHTPATMFLLKALSTLLFLLVLALAVFIGFLQR